MKGGGKDLLCWNFDEMLFKSPKGNNALKVVLLACVVSKAFVCIIMDPVYT